MDKYSNNITDLDSSGNNIFYKKLNLNSLSFDTLTKCISLFKNFLDILITYKGFLTVTAIISCIFIYITNLFLFLKSIPLVYYLIFIFMGLICIFISFIISGINKEIENITNSINYFNDNLKITIDSNIAKKSIPPQLFQLEPCEIEYSEKKEKGPLVYVSECMEKGCEYYKIEKYSDSSFFFNKAEEEIADFILNHENDESFDYDNYALYGNIYRYLGYSAEKQYRDPESKNKYFNSAKEYYLKAIDCQNEKIKESIKENKSHKPKNPYYFTNLGMIYEKLEAVKEAKDCYEKAIDINDKYIAIAYLKLGQLIKDKEPDNAIKKFNKAIEINKNSALAYRLRGDFFSEIADSECIKKAKIDYQYAYSVLRHQIISSFDQTGSKKIDPNMWNDLGEICIKLKSKDDEIFGSYAEKCFLEAIKLNYDSNTKARVNLGNYYLSISNFEESIKQFGEAYTRNIHVNLPLKKYRESLNNCTKKDVILKCEQIANDYGLF